MNRMIQLKQTTPVFLVVLLLCFGVLQGVQAVVPPPDGGYPNFTTAEGTNALQSLTTGSANTAVGWFSLESVTTGSFNTATGAGALLFNTANQNTAFGATALLFNTTGSNNTAVGAAALLNNTTGSFNTATGVNALLLNTTGVGNTANGWEALGNNTIGGGNTANGVDALVSNTTGDDNTATGSQALINNTIGSDNTAMGHAALFGNTEGIRNTATGSEALAANTTGSFNTAVGNQTLRQNTSGSFNIALRGGFNLTTGNFNIDIGSDGVAGESGTIRIGDGCCQSQAFIAGIFGTAVSGSTVVVDANGQLGVAPSSQRFKDDIKPMDKASEAIHALMPVTFHYKSDVKSIPCFGLVAEDVEKVNPHLVVRDKNGELLSVRYEQINAMLLNEFLKEHRKNAEQQATIARLQKQIEALTAGLQKVSAQLEASKPAPQVVNNP
jgi:hypothetical protein